MLALHYANSLRQVRITEAVVAARGEQQPGVLGDFVGSGERSSVIKHGVVYC